MVWGGVDDVASCSGEAGCKDILPSVLIRKWLRHELAEPAVEAPRGNKVLSYFYCYYYTRNIYNNSLMSCNPAANLLMRVMCLILDYVL